jgi:hypothetical protein
MRSHEAIKPAIPMKTKTSAITAIGILITIASVHAQTTLSGDHTVNGSLTVEDVLSVSGNAIDFGTTSSTNSAVAWQYGESGTNSTVALTATQPGTAFLWGDNAISNSVFKMKLDASNALSLFLPDGSAVGVFLDPTGVSSFSNSIVVAGTNNLMPNQTLSGNDSILTRGLADVLYLSSSPTTLAVNNSSLVVTSDGNVGIGRDNPEYALDVNGTIRANGLASEYGGHLYSSGPDSMLWYGDGPHTYLGAWHDTAGTYAILGVRAEEPAAAFVQYAAGEGNHLRIEVQGGALGEVRASSYGIGDYGNEVAMLNQDGSAFFAGNIGIGKTSPQVALDVAGSIAALGQVVVGDPYLTGYGGAYPIPLVLTAPWDNSEPGIQGNGGGDAVVAWLKANDVDYPFDLKVRLHPQTKTVSLQTSMHMVENTGVISLQYWGGTVGIGTMTPEAMLHVAGDARIDGALRITPQGDLSMGVYTNTP